MVEKALHTLSKVEKEMEHIVDANNSSQDLSDQTAREVKQLAERAAFTAAHAAETWGKDALNKAKEFTEEICL